MDSKKSELFRTSSSFFCFSVQGGGHFIRFNAWFAGVGNQETCAILFIKWMDGFLAFLGGESGERKKQSVSRRGVSE